MDGLIQDGTVECLHFFHHRMDVAHIGRAHVAFAVIAACVALADIPENCIQHNSFCWDASRI